MGIRGATAWLRFAHARGWLPSLARVRVGRGLSMDLPLRDPRYWWDGVEIRAYEAALLDAVAARAAALPRPLTVVDAGADVGLFSVLLAWRGVRPDCVVAVEPNRAVGAPLRSNLAQLVGSFRVVEAALAAAPGRGRLVDPDYARGAPHARYLVADAEGDIPMVELDALGLSREGSLLIKVDIEGGELDALRGGVATLRDAQHVLAVVEAHRVVFERTGRDLLDPARFLATLRPWRVSLAERQALELDLSRPYLDQSPDVEAGNLLIETVDGAGAGR